MKKIMVKTIIFTILLFFSLNIYANLENDTIKNYYLCATIGEYSLTIWKKDRMTVYCNNFKVKGRVDSINENGIFIKNKFITPNEIVKIKHFESDSFLFTSILSIPAIISSLTVWWIVNTIKNKIINQNKFILGIFYLALASFILAYSIYLFIMLSMFYLMFVYPFLFPVKYEKISIIKN